MGPAMPGHGTAAGSAASAGAARDPATISLATASPGGATADSAPAVDTKGLMLVRAQQDSWVDVRQADGSVLHNGLVKAGASIELKGSPPYRVVLGNATHVELAYEGKVQDLGPHIRANNIARLQLR